MRTVLGRRRSSIRPTVRTAGAPAKVSLSMPTREMSLKFPLGSRACMMELWRGAAQETPSTERTRVTSVSRIGLASLTCSTSGSLTQTEARMLTIGV